MTVYHRKKEVSSMKIKTVNDVKEALAMDTMLKVAAKMAREDRERIKTARTGMYRDKYHMARKAARPWSVAP